MKKREKAVTFMGYWGYTVHIVPKIVILGFCSSYLSFFDMSTINPRNGLALFVRSAVLRCPGEKYTRKSMGIKSPFVARYSMSGSLNVPMFHITQPLGIWSINVYNGYYKVMSNIPKSWDIYQPLSMSGSKGFC